MNKKTQLLDQIRFRGAFPLLKALHDGRRDEWIYRYSQQESFRNDISFLRSEGLITFVYDDLDSVVLSDLGTELVTIAEPARTMASTPSNLSNIARMLATADVRAEPPANLDQIADISDSVREQNKPALDKSYDIGREYVWFKFIPRTAADYQIDILANEAQSDPFAVFLEAGTDRDKWLTSDDDGEGFNPRFWTRLEQGKTYLVGVRMLEGDRGTVRFDIVG